jgi:EAL domain-containing protein (putative c-di-GMP-specific phosphodiesterase class I)
MYRAKRQGKACWHVFDDALIEEATHRSELEVELRTALERREFVVQYQPIFDLKHYVVVGAEALLRWNHPSRGLLHPGQFMAVAEQSGCTAGILEWVLAEACAQQRRWEHELGFPNWVSVSMSAREIVEPGLAATMTDILALTDMSPSNLWLALSETLARGRPRRVGRSA